MAARVEIFCDGACLGNPGPGGWGAIVFDHSEGTVTELGGSERHTTNNAMEIRAALESLRAALNFAGLEVTVEVKTDSSYVIHGASKWLGSWKSNGWITREGKAVANVELWRELAEILEKFASPTRLNWTHVAGHSGIAGNERADQIASTFAAGEKPDLFRGEKKNYLGGETSDPKKKFPIYLSLVAGKLARHETWVDCETRVKGASGAKFKKVSSSIEENQTLKSWNLIK